MAGLGLVTALRRLWKSGSTLQSRSSSNYVARKYWSLLPLLGCHHFIRDDLPLLVFFSPQQRQRGRMVPRRAQRKQRCIIISIFLLLGGPVSRCIRILRRSLVAQKRPCQVVGHRHQRVGVFSRVFDNLQILVLRPPR